MGLSCITGLISVWFCPPGLALALAMNDGSSFSAHAKLKKDYP